MWMDTLPNGKFKFTERYFDPKTGKHRKVSVTLTSGSRQAGNKAGQLLRAKIAKKTDQKTTDQRYTFAEMTDLWLADHKNRVALGTFVGYKHVATQLARAPFGKYLLQAITLKDAQDYFTYLQADRGYSLGTTRRYYTTMHQIFDHANTYYDYELLLPWRKIHLLPDKIVKPQNFIDPAEVPNFIAAAREKLNGLHADCVEVALLTGLRYSELVALTIDDLDTVQHKLSINKAFNLATLKISPTLKTKCAARVIDTTPRLEEILIRRHQLTQAQFNPAPRELFVSIYGIVSNSVLNGSLNKLGTITFHGLRHTHICMLIEHGAPLKYVARRVGHSDISTTLKVYTHLTAGMEDQGRKLVNQLF